MCEISTNLFRKIACLYINYIIFGWCKSTVI